TLRLTRSGTVGATGSISITTGTALDFASNYSLAKGSMVSSPLVIFSSGTVNLNGDYTATAETRVSGGTANFNAAGTVHSVGMLTMSGGTFDGSNTANFSSGKAINVSSLNQSGGTL